jgi:2-polyprenyl-3-methyl-5-hydroxy-6-metoxy-1,4-benzoquinol methylase
LLGPLERDEADAVFGSRMLVAGAALKGGMPLRNFVGNRILSTLENALLGMGLSEFHSGYRLYSMAALKDVPFEKNTHDFHFDTQIIIQLHAAQKRIVELPIPAHHEAEVRQLNGIRYAKDVLFSVLRYRAHELGLTHRPEYAIAPTYNAKESARGSHAQLVEMIPKTAKRVLDLGCGEGAISVALVKRGHEVISIDSQAPKPPLPHFIRADLTEEWPLTESHCFDAIVLADVLEHVIQPHELLLRTLPHLTNRGRIFVSIPNVAHWSVRALVLSGKFDYTSRGILDEGHVRFFTRRSAERMFRDVGLRVETYRATPVPWERVLPRALSTMVNVVEEADYMLTRIHPGLFAYQHLFELVPNTPFD